VGFAFAIAEYGAARAAWLRKLRMSFEERKREVKEEEGDASARGRRRALHRTLLRSGMRRLKDASFVVANPEHVAVALEYNPPRVCVPRVLVRAADAAAAVVRATAVRYGVPIVENVWLARALYRDGRAGEPIPHPLYVAVAEIVVALHRAQEPERK
jgi:flagellar biosynthesis protein FlhB